MTSRKISDMLKERPEDWVWAYGSYGSVEQGTPAYYCECGRYLTRRERKYTRKCDDCGRDKNTKKPANGD
jgi:hypothetical protein